ncbi:MAG: FG-GAP-like repeat-containing protein [Myxococcota bacterium]
MTHTKHLLTLLTTLAAVGIATPAYAAEPPFSGPVGLLADDISGGAVPHFGDMDNDGDLDIVLAGATSIYVYENTDGISAPMPEVVVDPGLFAATDALVGDVDGDGDLDIVAAGGGLRWYENIEDASGFAPHVLDADDEVFGELGLGDLDGDGLRDVVLADTDSDVLRWFANPGPGGDWGAGQTITTDFDDYQYLVVSDFVGDGGAEIVLAGDFGNTLALLDNDEGSWTATALDAGSGVEELRASDVDGDGDIDVLVGQDEDAVVLRNLGDGVFGTVPIASTDASDVGFQLDAGDVDGDGDVDLVSVQFTLEAGVAWHENEGGDFTAQHTIQDEMPTFATVEVGDADCDGDADVLVFGTVDDLLDVYVFENTTLAPSGEPTAACIGAGDEGAVDAGGDDGMDDGMDDGTGDGMDDGTGDGVGDGTGDGVGDGADGSGDAGDSETTGAADGGDGTGGSGAGGDDGGGSCSVHTGRSTVPLAWCLAFVALGANLRRRGRA